MDTANLRENIVNGFESTRTLEKQLNTFNDLQQHPVVLRGDPYGDIPADVRKGSSNKPYGQGN